MAWTTSDLTAVESAIARGARVVTFGDKSITYNSLDDLLRVRALIANSLAGRTGLSYVTPDFSDSTDSGSFDANQ